MTVENEQRYLNALGDSLTHGDNTGKGGEGTPWTAYIPSLTGLCCRNYGINGNRLAGPDGMADRCGAMARGASLVSVWGGMNDFCGGAALGHFGDRGIDTFYGALDTLARRLYAGYPGAGIFFITPPKCRSRLHGWETFTPNGVGHTLKEYRDAIVEEADYYSLPVLDMYAMGGMSCYLDDSRFRPDGLHYSDEGYARVAHIIAGFIRAHFPELVRE